MLLLRRLLRSPRAPYANLRRHVLVWPQILAVCSLILQPIYSTRAIYVPDANSNPYWLPTQPNEPPPASGPNTDDDGTGQPVWRAEFAAARDAGTVVWWGGARVVIDGLWQDLPGQYHLPVGDQDLDGIPDDLDPYPADANNNSYYWGGGTFMVNNSPTVFAGGYFQGASADYDGDGIPDASDPYVEDANNGNSASTFWWGGGTFTIDNQSVYFPAGDYTGTNTDTDSDGIPDAVDPYPSDIRNGNSTEGVWWPGGTFIVDGISTTFSGQNHSPSAGDADTDGIPDDLDPYPNDATNNSFWWSGGSYYVNGIEVTFFPQYYAGQAGDSDNDGIPDCVDAYIADAANNTSWWAGGTFVIDGVENTFQPQYYAGLAIDADGDGIPDVLDPYPNDPLNGRRFFWPGGEYMIRGVLTTYEGAWLSNELSDADGDGLPDSIDPYPNDNLNDSIVWQGGGFIINGNYAFLEWRWHRASAADADNDGMPDDVDPYPEDASNNSFSWAGGTFTIENSTRTFLAQWFPGTYVDSDGDGIPDAADPYPDSAENGNTPLTYEWQGGTFEIDHRLTDFPRATYAGTWSDSDNDGIPDPADPYPTDATNNANGWFHWGGGTYLISNNSRSFDEGWYPGAWSDDDGDGIPNVVDPFPADANNQNSTIVWTSWAGGTFVIDGDPQDLPAATYQGTFVDTDGDTIPDALDPYPTDATNGSVTWGGGQFLIENTIWDFPAGTYRAGTGDSDHDGIPDKFDPYINDKYNGNTFVWPATEITLTIGGQPCTFTPYTYPGVFADRDSDGIPDVADVYGDDPTNHNDTDQDGLPDYIELQYGLDPNNPGDANQLRDDGVSFLEAFQYGLALTFAPGETPNFDADGDGMSDRYEITWGFNPHDPADAYESAYGDLVFAYEKAAHHDRPDYVVPDYEYSLYTGHDLNNIGYDLNLSYRENDWDGDGVSNVDEGLVFHTDPRLANSRPSLAAIKQSLAEGQASINTRLHYLWLISGPSPSITDTDGDGLPDWYENLLGLNRELSDTDGDGLPDGWEVQHGLNALNSGDVNTDDDGDGLTNLEEFRLGTDPNQADNDGSKVIVLKVTTSRLKHELYVRYANGNRYAPRVLPVPIEKIQPPAGTGTLFTPYRVFTVLVLNRYNLPWSLEDATTNEQTASNVQFAQAHAADPSKPTMEEYLRTQWISTPKPIVTNSANFSPFVAFVGFYNNPTTDGRYEVDWRIGTGGAYFTIAHPSAATPYYEDYGLAPKTLYGYRVRYQYGRMQSAYGTVNVLTPAYNPFARESQYRNYGGTGSITGLPDGVPTGGGYVGVDGSGTGEDESGPVDRAVSQFLDVPGMTLEVQQQPNSPRTPAEGHTLLIHWFIPTDNNLVPVRVELQCAEGLNAPWHNLQVFTQSSGSAISNAPYSCLHYRYRVVATYPDQRYAVSAVKEYVVPLIRSVDAQVASSHVGHIGFYALDDSPGEYSGYSHHGPGEDTELTIGLGGRTVTIDRTTYGTDGMYGHVYSFENNKLDGTYSFSGYANGNRGTSQDPDNYNDAFSYTYVYNELGAPHLVSSSGEGGTLPVFYYADNNFGSGSPTYYSVPNPGDGPDDVWQLTGFISAQDKKALAAASYLPFPATIWGEAPYAVKDHFGSEEIDTQRLYNGESFGSTWVSVWTDASAANLGKSRFQISFNPPGPVVDVLPVVAIKDVYSPPATGNLIDPGLPAKESVEYLKVEPGMTTSAIYSRDMNAGELPVALATATYGSVQTTISHPDDPVLLKFWEITGEKTLTPVAGPELSAAPPVIDLDPNSGVTITNIHPAADGASLLANIHVQAAVTSKMLDSVEGDSGKITQLDWEINPSAVQTLDANGTPGYSSLDSGTINVSATKGSNANSDLRPFPYNGTANSTLSNVKISEGLNTLRLTAHDPVHGHDGYVDVAFTVTASARTDYLSIDGSTLSLSFPAGLSDTQADPALLSFTPAGGSAVTVILAETAANSRIFKSQDQKVSVEATGTVTTTKADTLAATITWPAAEMYEVTWPQLIESSATSLTFTHQGDDSIELGADYRNYSVSLSLAAPDMAAPVGANPPPPAPAPAPPVVPQPAGPGAFIIGWSKAGPYHKYMIEIAVPKDANSGPGNANAIFDFIQTQSGNIYRMNQLPASYQASTGVTQRFFLSQHNDGTKFAVFEIYAYNREQPALDLSSLKALTKGLQGFGPAYMAGLKYGGLQMIESAKQTASDLLNGLVDQSGKFVENPWLTLKDAAGKTVDVAAGAIQTVSSFAGAARPIIERIATDGDAAITALLADDDEALAQLSEPYQEMLFASAELLGALYEEFTDLSVEEKAFLAGQMTPEVVSAFIPAGGALRVLSKLEFLEKLGSLRFFGGASGRMARVLQRMEVLRTEIKKTKMCFVAGTPIETARGKVPIEQITPGTWVWSRDEATGRQALRPVVQTFVTHPDRLCHIRYSALGRHAKGGGSDDGGDEDSELVCTPEHPFYVESKGAFVAAGDLKIGDQLRLIDGHSAALLRIDWEPASTGGTFTTYNFEVAEFHTYFAGGVWVHNSGAPCEKIFSTFFQKAKAQGGVANLRGERFKLLLDTKAALRKSGIPASNWADAGEDVCRKMFADARAGQVALSDMPSVNSWWKYFGRKPSGADGRHVHHSVEKWIQRDKLGITSGFDDVPGWVMDGTKHTPGKGTLAHRLGTEIGPLQDPLAVTTKLREIYQSEGLDDLWEVSRIWLNSKGIPTPP